jgi:hypothetical protein
MGGRVSRKSFSSLQMFSVVYLEVPEGRQNRSFVPEGTFPLSPSAVDPALKRWAILGGSAKRPERVCKMAVSAKGALEFRKF